MTFQFAKCISDCLNDGEVFASAGDVIKVFTAQDKEGRFDAWNASADKNGYIYLDQVKFLSPFRRQSSPTVSEIPHVDASRVTPIKTFGLANEVSPQKSGIPSARSYSTGLLPSAGPCTASEFSERTPPITNIQPSFTTPISARSEHGSKSNYTRVSIFYRQSSVIINLPCSIDSDGDIVISPGINQKLRSKILRKFGIFSLENLYLIHKETSEKFNLHAACGFMKYRPGENGTTNFIMKELNANKICF